MDTPAIYSYVHHKSHRACRNVSNTVFVKWSHTHAACFRFFIDRACTPRAQNTTLVQAVTIDTPSAMLRQARHVTSPLVSTLHVTTGQVVSCRLKTSAIWASLFQETARLTLRFVRKKIFTK